MQSYNGSSVKTGATNDGYVAERAKRKQHCSHRRCKSSNKPRINKGRLPHSPIKQSKANVNRKHTNKAGNKAVNMSEQKLLTCSGETIEEFSRQNPESDISVLGINNQYLNKNIGQKHKECGKEFRNKLMYKRNSNQNNKSNVFVNVLKMLTIIVFIVIRCISSSANIDMELNIQILNSNVQDCPTMEFRNRNFCYSVFLSHRGDLFKFNQNFLILTDASH